MLNASAWTKTVSVLRDEMTDSTASTDSDRADGFSDRLDHARQRELVQGLLQAVVDRVHAEKTLADGQAGRSETEDRGYEEACRALEQKRDAARATIIRQYDLVRDETLSQIDAEISATQIEYDDRVAELQQKSEGDQERIEKERDEAEKQRGEDGDNRDHHQQFDQSEATAGLPNGGKAGAGFHGREGISRGPFSSPPEWRQSPA